MELVAFAEAMYITTVNSRLHSDRSAVHSIAMISCTVFRNRIRIPRDHHDIIPRRGIIPRSDPAFAQSCLDRSFSFCRFVCFREVSVLVFACTWYLVGSSGGSLCGRTCGAKIAASGSRRGGWVGGAIRRWYSLYIGR